MQHPDQIRLLRGLGLCLSAALALALAMPAMAQMPSPSACGDLGNGANGPFDYRNERRDLLMLGEANHFTPGVETLTRGKSSYIIGGDIHFILMMFPNHARALMAMMRLGEKEKSQTTQGALYPVECYFERALRFRPDDNLVRMIYATFLSKNARTPEALQQLEYVTAKAGDNAFTHYNAGLQYFELKQYDKALAQAHAAIALDFPRTELRELLKSVGKWIDPVAAPAPAASAASAASAAASAPP